MEKELRRAFEETTTRNVTAILDHANATRKLLREMENRMAAFEFMIKSQRETIDLVRTQLAAIQQKVYKNGTV